MSASARACQFYVDERSLIQPQFPMKHKEVFTSSDIECPSSKKPRISATRAYPNFQTVLNEARFRNVKTQLCRKFRLGICTLGSRCNYAHCIGELRRQDNLTKEYPLAETFGGDYRTHHEPQLCRMFFQGKQCSYGHSCRFLHVRQDSLNSRERAMIEMIPTGAVEHGKSESGQLEFKRVSNANFDPEVNPKRLQLKTRLCNKWEMKGYCPFGKICRFAHGQAELGKLDGYSSSEYRVLQTSKANTTANASNSKTATGPLLKKEPYPINCKFKRKELHKISRIYGDWM